MADHLETQWAFLPALHVEAVLSPLRASCDATIDEGGKVKQLLGLLWLTIGIASAQTPHSETLSWAWSQGSGAPATGFNVYRSVTPGGLQVKLTSLNGAGTLGYVDLSGTGNILAEGTNYCYTVTAVGTGGESVPSNQACASIPFSVPPSGPTNLTVVAH